MGRTRPTEAHVPVAPLEQRAESREKREERREQRTARQLVVNDLGSDNSLLA